MDEKKNLKKELLEKIKSGKIEQKSKWYFLTKSYVFWFFASFSTVLGSFAISSILFQLMENKRAFMMPKGPETIAEGFVEALPYWWVLAFVSFILIAYINYKNTYKSYKRESIYIISISILVSFILGFIIFNIGIAEKMEHKSRELFPGYKKHIEIRKNRVKDFLLNNGCIEELEESKIEEVSWKFIETNKS